LPFRRDPPSFGTKFLPKLNSRAVSKPRILVTSVICDRS
jgi:hypothetical protein